jgi:hypothetical protein
LPLPISEKSMALTRRKLLNNKLNEAKMISNSWVKTFFV